MAQNRLQYFYATVWKDDNASYFPSGEVRALPCMHAKDGIYGVNIKGQIFSLPDTVQVPQGETSPPTSPPTGTDWQTQQVLVGPSHVYGTEASPFATDSSNYKICVRIKDLTNNLVSYVDKTEYDANISTCNPTSYTGVCPILVITSSGNTSVSFNWQWIWPAAVVGIEYVFDQVAGDPSGSGTFIAASEPNNLLIEGLDSGETYYFHVRVICAAGSLSAWLNEAGETTP